MATPVEMPKLGNTVEECILAKWNKERGDKVSAGETIAEIETDKATFELTAPIGGSFLEAFFEPGELVPVFTNICVIGDPGESVEPYRPAQPAPMTAEAPPAVVAEQTPSPAPAAEGAFLSPRARAFAKEHGLLPPSGIGSGPGGRVLEQDLRRLYDAHGLEEPPVRMSGIREKIARRMRESLAASAQYTLHSSAEATGMLVLRDKIKHAQQTTDLPDVTINEMVMFATVQALTEMPELNAELIDGKLYRRPMVHLGFACDTERGLLVPVVRDSNNLSLDELSRRVKRLAEQALDGTIAVDDLTGATFTVSNLGSLGIQSFTPILNPPQIAILGVNSIELRPVRREDRLELVDHIGLSLTCDHQVIDGAQGARFLKILRERIEAIESISDISF